MRIAFAFFVGILAPALGLSAPAKANLVVVDFDSVDTSGGFVTGAPVANYLAGFGITFDNAFSINGSSIYDLIGPYSGLSEMSPVSTPNFLGSANSDHFYRYDLSFATPPDSVSFTRPGLSSTAIADVWTVTAYSSANIVLSAVGGDQTTPTSTQTYTLTGPGIAYIRVTNDALSVEQSFYPLVMDDLTLRTSATPLPAALPLLASGVGAIGFLCFRKKKKRAAAATM